MYRCQECGVNVGPNAQSHTARKGVRLKSYPPQPILRGAKGRQKKKRNIRFSDGGRGWEAEQKLRVCRSCHDTMEAAFEEELELALKGGYAEPVVEEERWAAK